MDQIGAIGPGTVEELVLWAKDNRFRGSIDVRGEVAASLSFSAGFVAHIDDGGGEPSSSDADTKERVHARLATRLAGLLAFTDGTYVIHRSEQLPPEARWLFGPQGLLDSARSQSVSTDPSTWADTPVRLDDRRVEGPVRMGADAFRIVAAMARSTNGGALQRDLGWSSERVDRALGELDHAGLLAPRGRAAGEGAAATVPPSTRPAPPVLDLRPDDRRQAVDPHPAGAGDRALPSRADTPAPPAPARADAERPLPIERTTARVTTDESRTADAATTGSRTRASALRRLIQNLR